MSASIKDKNIIIENGYIKKEFVIRKNRISSFEIENKISGKILTVGKGSEEFVLSLKGKSRFSRKLIRASQLSIKDAALKNEQGKTVLKIDFRSFSFRDSKILVSAIYELEDEASFLNKHLEISFEKIGKKEVVLDYISFEHFEFDTSLMNWTVPKQKNSHIPGFALMLGQPVYVDSLYLGCEFPLCYNFIKEGDRKSVV